MCSGSLIHSNIYSCNFRPFYNKQMYKLHISDNHLAMLVQCNVHLDTKATSSILAFPKCSVNDRLVVGGWGNRILS